ncbi:MAG: phosphatidate cytidylyltransferase [Actinomycetota bacterium]|nr:phosphatidate cytidylyltransferase [Actinomycetota bacterium]
MPELVSRVAVAAVGLPVVLGVVWLGGWWVFGLVLVAALVALHEFFSMTRSLRPLVLAGYAGALAALLGARLGGVDWMVGGFLATLAFAFVLYMLASTRAPATVAISSTVLGTAWIALGLGHVVLLRDLPTDGRLALLTLLLAVFAADIFAYFAGLLVGRHKLAPTVSPGKTWEGFLAGTLAAIFVTFVALYEQGLLDGWRPLVLGGVIALAAPVGDLFQSSLKRDMEVKDTGRLLAGHGGVLDRIDSLLFASVAAFYVILAFGAA